MNVSPIPIWTLDARDSLHLPIAAGYYGLEPGRIRAEITTAHREVCRLLAWKRIDYRALRAALEPSRERNELALIFDVEKIGRGHYGRAASELIIPLLDRRSKHSFLSGDLLGSRDLVNALVGRSMHYARASDINAATMSYAVYINNLSASAAERIHGTLSAHDGYRGYVSCTFESPVRTYLSFVLTGDCIKCGEAVISMHEDDADPDRDWDLRNWAWEESGYRLRSIQSMYFDLFLRYKIERQVRGGQEILDQLYSVNAVSDVPQDVRNFRVVIDQSKFDDYLLTNKLGMMRALGLADSSLSDLKATIQNKVAQSYFYSLLYRKEHDLSRFNLMLELPPVGHGLSPKKALASFEYQPQSSSLRLITLY